LAQHGTLGKIDIRQLVDAEVGIQKLDIYNDALTHVQSRGLAVPSLPVSGYKGEMPQDITSLDDDKLGDLLNNLSQYCGFIDVELSAAQTKLDVAKAQYEFLYSRVRVGVKATIEGKMTDKDRSDLVITDPRIHDSQCKLLYSEAVYRLIRNIRDQVQRSWDTVSRRITQRGQDIDRMKRESNVAGVPSHGRTFHRPGQ
jgi:hypothetical protein